MNQILITKKLYITPELKRKKKIYKANFILSVFFLVILVSLYIYTAYARDKAAAVSQEILENAEIGQDDTVADSDVLIAVLNDTTDDGTQAPVVVSQENTNKTKQQSQSGYTYVIDGTITIPKINVEYAILDGETDSELETEELLKISPVKFHGPEINEVGNYCIVGHNYRNGKMFGRLHELKNGDIVELEDLTGRKVKYKVYEKKVVEPTDTSCTSQKTKNGEDLRFRELTLITCTNYGTQRLVVKCREV